MEISPGTLEGMEDSARMGQVGSLDAHIGEDGDTTVGDMVPGTDNVEMEVHDKVEAEGVYTGSNRMSGIPA